MCSFPLVSAVNFLTFFICSPTSGVGAFITYPFAIALSTSAILTDVVITCFFALLPSLTCLTCFLTKKNGRRYRYYVPQRDAKEHAGASGLPRLSAAELESAVLDQLRAILRAPNLLGDMLPQAIKLDPTLDEARITVAMTRLDAIWDQLFPAEQTRIVKLLVEKVIVSPNDLEVRLRANGIERLVLELRPEPVEQTEEALA